MQKPEILNVILKDGVELRRVGDKYLGLCPFHADRNPSFYVFRDIQRFKCFGCGVNGDVFDYWQLRHNVSFVEARSALSEELPVRQKKKSKRKGISEYDRWVDKTIYELYTEKQNIHQRLKVYAPICNELIYNFIDEDIQMETDIDYMLYVLEGENDKVKHELYEEERDGTLSSKWGGTC